jgi:hypothetical protein
MINIRGVEGASMLVYIMELEKVILLEPTDEVE